MFALVPMDFSCYARFAMMMPLSHAVQSSRKWARPAGWYGQPSLSLTSTTLCRALASSGSRHWPSKSKPCEGPPIFVAQKKPSSPCGHRGRAGGGGDGGQALAPDGAGAPLLLLLLLRVLRVWLRD